MQIQTFYPCLNCLLGSTGWRPLSLQPVWAANRICQVLPKC